MAEKVVITDDQMRTLPIREIYVGGMKRQVRLDSERKRMYLLGADGEYTGKSTFWNPENERNPVVPVVGEVAEQPVPIPEEGAPQENPPMAEQTEQRKEKRISPVRWVFLGVALILAFTIICYMLRGSSESGDSPKKNTTISERETSAGTRPDGTSPTTEGQHPTSPSAPSSPTGESGEKVMVIVAAEDILPGESLRFAPLKKQAISAEEYRVLSVVANVYTAAEMERVQQLVANRYIPAGKYLVGDDLASSFSPVLPWAELDVGQISVRLPVKVRDEELASYMWGNQIDIWFTHETIYFGDTVPDYGELELPTGVYAESVLEGTMLTTTYHIQGAVIRDVFNASKESLYSEFYKWTLLPQEAREDYWEDRYPVRVLVEADRPRTIQVSLTEEQARFVASLDIENMEMHIRVKAPSCATSLQNEVYLKLQEVAKEISAMWREVE